MNDPFDPALYEEMRKDFDKMYKEVEKQLSDWNEDKLTHLRTEYLRLMHAIQTGVACDHQNGSPDQQPKHLRVGVNSALIQDAAIVRLLVKKGVITEIEYFEQLNQELREEIARYETRLSENYSKPIKLI